MSQSAGFFLLRVGAAILQSGPFWIFCVASVMAFVAFSLLGVPGLAVAAAGLLGVIALTYVFLFKPELIFVSWVLAMSSVTYVGLLRMPGVPDFSFPRMLLLVMMFLILVGTMTGRPLFVRPILPDVLIITHTVYVLINLKLIGNPEAFHSWYNSSLAPLVAYLYARQWIKTDAQLKLLTYSMLAILLYFGIVAVGEHFEIPSLVWPREIMDRSIMSPFHGRSRGPFFQPAIFGMMIGMLFLLNVYALTRKVGSLVKVLLWANLVLSGLALLYTYTRGGWVSTIVGLVFLAVARPRFRKVLIFGTVIGALVGGFGLAKDREDDVLASRIENTGTIENRLGFLASATRMIRINPVFGVGYFRYMELEYLYNKGTYIPLYGYVTKEIGAGVPIHDIYIGRAAEEGLVSLALFLGFLYVVGWEFLKKWRVVQEGVWFGKDAMAVFGAIIIAYLLGGLVVDFRYFDNVNVLAFFFCGLVVGFPHRAQKIDSSQPQCPPRTSAAVP